MARKQTRTLYTLAEIKAQFPDAYTKIKERWEAQCEQDSDIPWQDETMDSLKAVVKCFGRMGNWNIGPYAHSYLSVDLPDYTDTDDDGNDTTPTDLEIVKREFDKRWPDRFKTQADWEAFYLRAKSEDSTLGLSIASRMPDNMPKDAIHFTGVCPFTGYCADDTFAEYVYWAVRTGYSTLKEALEECAGIAAKMMEDDCEQQKDEESMEASWGDNEYTDDGEEV